MGGERASSGRLQSLDALRGFDMIWILGFIESLGVVVLCWLTCWFLNRHRLYLKV